MNLQTQIHTDVNELHEYRLQVTEGGSGLHTETQLLLKVTAKRNLNTTWTNSMSGRREKRVILLSDCVLLNVLL